MEALVSGLRLLSLKRPQRICSKICRWTFGAERTISKLNDADLLWGLNGKAAYTVKWSWSGISPEKLYHWCSSR